jgi:hypothetical protein
LRSVGREIIVVRSLAESDLGIFSAHRSAATSKQRAIALTTPIARQLLSPRLFEQRGADLDVLCVYGGYAGRELRNVGKITKNWRLGGRQIGASEFAFLDSKDFVLLRSREHNDGDHPVLMTFVGRQRERIMHAGIAASLAEKLRDSTALIPDGSETFDGLAAAFAPVPAHLALAIPDQGQEDPLLRRIGGRDGG